MKSQYQLIIAAAMLMASCTKNNQPPKEILGYAPVYKTDAGVTEIKSGEPQAIVQGGKIYIKDNTLYQVEVTKGIHVLDIQNPSQPIKKGFIQIPGAQEISIKGNLLYSNNFNDLVVVDISNIQNVTVVKRMASVFEIADVNGPPESGYFKCIDPNKGEVIGWKKEMLYSPNCKTN